MIAINGYIRWFDIWFVLVDVTSKTMRFYKKSDITKIKLTYTEDNTDEELYL